jgi:hypothetical protein
MARFPPEKLRFDAAIGLAAILEHAHGPALRTAYNRTKEVADHDTDNPLRRAFDATNRADKSVTAGWEIPKPGERVNVNRIVAEALHCRENGIRPEALDYATGGMRDQGGYQTTHALWALTIARDNKCIPDFAARAKALIDELRAAEPDKPGPAALDVDLFAERLLMLELAGDPNTQAWARKLVAAQNADGSWGQLAAGEDPYHQFHATLVATWALSLQKM